MKPPLYLICWMLLATATSAQPGGSLGAVLSEVDLTLRTTDGESTTLNGAMGENGLVVAFWSNVCPWTERYADRIVALARDYQPIGISFLAINSNDSTRFPDEDFASMRRTAASEGFPFPYAMDAAGAFAAAAGARNAPQFFFYSPDGRLLYEGAMDDSPADADRVRSPYLKEAMDQHLAGQAIEVQRTSALGCTIKLPQ